MDVFKGIISFLFFSFEELFSKNESKHKELETQGREDFNLTGIEDTRNFILKFSYRY